MKRVVRLLALLVPLALASGVTPAFANDEEGYLALGDSVAFGFSPIVFASNPTNIAAYVGYPEVLGEEVVNASCPGETSGSFINGPPDNGCAGFRSVAPLHVSYQGTQLAFAAGFLQTHPSTQLVTIDIGANDLFILLRSCQTAASPAACVQSGLPGLLSALAGNLATIYGALRQAGFRGTLVVVTYYVLNFADANSVALLSAINSVDAAVTTQFGGRVADGFGAFQREAAQSGGDSCAAGLLIKLPTGGCDIHPSMAGQELLAEAIDAVID